LAFRQWGVRRGFGGGRADGKERVTSSVCRRGLETAGCMNKHYSSQRRRGMSFGLTAELVRRESWADVGEKRKVQKGLRNRSKG